MKTINNCKFSYKILAFILAFLIALAPLGNLKRVDAVSTTEMKVVAGVGITSLILSSLAHSGSISGNFSLTEGEITTIRKKAQENLNKLGTAAVEQANKLGDAIASGAESAKIKALATGAVIYAFAKAIQETLFPKTINNSSESNVSYPYIVEFNIVGGGKGFFISAVEGAPVPLGGWKKESVHYFSRNYSSFFNGPGGFIGRLYLESVELNINTGWWVKNVNIDNRLLFYVANESDFKYNLQIYLDGANAIASAPSITIPTELPTDILDNITNWDGTSDLVLAPPLPWEIPDGQDLVIDPGYVGEGTENPPVPTTDPDNPPSEEEGIIMPWLAALLGLLGFGNPTLEGIDAGVKTAIDKIIDQITASAQDVYDGFTDALTGIDVGVQSIVDAITGAISVPLEGIWNWVLSIPDFFAIPAGLSIANVFTDNLPDVFPIIGQINTALNKISVDTRPLIIYYPYLDGTTKEINLNWYEPVRQQIRNGIGVVFKVITVLACFAMVSNVFGIGLRVGTGQAYTDRPSEDRKNGKKKGE